MNVFLISGLSGESFESVDAIRGILKRNLALSLVVIIKCLKLRFLYVKNHKDTTTQKSPMRTVLLRK